MIRDCPVCGGGPGRVRTVSGKSRIGGAPLELATCGVCGVVFQPFQVTMADLTTWYDYVGTVDKVAAEPSDLLGQRVSRLLAEVSPYRQQGTLLDVGCGRGTIALAAQATGWSVSATEISKTAVAALRPHLGDRIFEGDLLEAPFALGSFDAVLMIEVLEHLADPVSYLDRARQLLRPGGAVLLTTPNWNGLSARLRGVRWRVVADEHLNYFSEPTLRRILATSGYDRIRIATTGVDLPFAYSIVRSVGRRQATGGMTATGSAARSARGRGADAAIELANRLLRRVKLGDTLRAVAERPRG